jgi:hypothetical protein
VILAIWEAEVREWWLQDRPGKKFERSHLNRKQLEVGAHVYHPIFSRERIGGS